MTGFSRRDWLIATLQAAFLLAMSTALVVGLAVVAAIGGWLP